MFDLSDVASERAVLSCICKFGGNAYFECSDLINSETFTVDSNQIIWKCLASIFEKNSNTLIDVPLILSAAHKLNYEDFFERRGEKEHLRAIFNNNVYLENTREFAKKIKKLEVARKAYSLTEEIQQSLLQVKGEESIDEILGMMEGPLIEFSIALGSTGGGPKKMGEGAQEYVKYLGENECPQVGISTGFPLYDYCIGGGLRRKTVNIIGARMKVGKTTIADNIGLHIAGKLGIPALNLDTEMDDKDHKHRILANLSKVPIREIENGSFYKDDKKREEVEKAAEYFESIPYFHESIVGRPFQETLSCIRRWLMKEVGFNSNGTIKDCVVIYDYIKLMTADSLSKNLAEHQALGFLVSDLHNFTAKYDIPCLALVQLNRDGILQESTGVVAGSDRILMLCSNFSILKTKSDEEIAEDGPDGGNRKLVPLICRHGPGIPDKEYISMQFDGETNSIREVEIKTGNDDERQDFLSDGDIPF